MPWLAGSRPGVDGQLFPPAGGDSRSQSGDGNEAAARKFQPRMEPAAREAGSCVSGTLQVDTCQRIGQRSILLIRVRCRILTKLLFSHPNDTEEVLNTPQAR